jgi:hypothetical protein
MYVRGDLNTLRLMDTSYTCSIKIRSDIMPKNYSCYSDDFKTEIVRNVVIDL